MPSEIKILSFEINNITPFYGMSTPCKVMGSPLKIGSINLFVDRLPNFVYQRDGNLFYAVDCGFVSIYKREPGTTDAFGGSKFDIALRDGTAYHSSGDLWDPFSWSEFVERLGFGICSVGINTRDKHCNCPVFTGCKIDIRIINNLLDLTVGRHSDSLEENKEAVATIA